MNASVQSVSSDLSSLFNSLFTAEEKGILLLFIHYNEICYLCVIHRPASSHHPQPIFAKSCTKYYVNIWKNYFSFIQALLCTLVSTERVCNYVQFFYFVLQLMKRCCSLKAGDGSLDFCIHFEKFSPALILLDFFIHCTKFMQHKKNFTTV